VARRRDDTDWCRVVQPYAGDGFGAIWIPEEKMEVLVSFVHGDMNEAIVLGGLYNGKDKPPAFRDKTKQDIKMWRTKVGHEIRLDDSDNQHAIEILTAGNHSVILDDQNKQIAISSAGGAQITLDDNSRNIEIAVGKGKITIDAIGNIAIEGTTIKVSGQAITLSAQQVSLGA
jgi:phage baseplate assembly protein V